MFLRGGSHLCAPVVLSPKFFHRIFRLRSFLTLMVKSELNATILHIDFDGEVGAECYNPTHRVALFIMLRIIIQ